MYFLFIFLSLCIKLVKCDGADCAINGYEKYYSSSGNVYVIGLFDAHKGENCSISNPAVLQQMYNVAVTVSLLNNLNYVPGVTIGMALYDTCTSKDIAQKTLISSLVDANCNVPYNLGIVSPKVVSEMIYNFTKIANIPVYTLDYESKPAVILNISVKLIKELGYNRVDVAVLPNFELIRNFNQITLQENVCVGVSYTFSHFDDSCPGDNMLVFIAVTNAELSPLLKLSTDCLSTFVIAILDNNVDLPSVTEHLLLHESYIIIPSNIWPEFSVAVEDDFESVVTTIQKNLHYSNVTMDFIRTSSVVISVVDHFKSKLDAECGPSASPGSPTLCANLSRFQKSDEKISDKYSLNIPQVLGIEKRTVLQYLVLKSHFNRVDPFAEVHMVDNETNIRFANGISLGGAVFCDWASDECQNCSNFAHDPFESRISKFFDRVPFRLKPNGWVPSMLTICIIGIVSCACVLCFIVGRIFKEDILEGNPCSTFLLIVATILTYLVVLPFTVEEDPTDRTLCVLKLFGTSISYSFIFSVILSRVLMILTCDYNGSFMSHINGYLQSFLCFFMFAVQFGLIFEFYIFGWVLSEIDYCSEFLDNNYFLMYLLYDMFLLLLIALVVPFVTKSRRNYKEGLCFTILAACFVMIWSFWCVGYFVTSAVGRDFFVAFGLTGTASSVVVCVLIPRTYLIATGIVRDRITSAIPSNISNLIDMNYRSTQALYDSVHLDTAKKGESNVGYYDDLQASSSSTRSDVLTRRKSADVIVHNAEGHYEDFTPSAADQKITKF